MCEPLQGAAEMRRRHDVARRRDLSAIIHDFVVLDNSGEHLIAIKRSSKRNGAIGSSLHNKKSHVHMLTFSGVTRLDYDLNVKLTYNKYVVIFVIFSRVTFMST